jgi:hypothetical protein
VVRLKGTAGDERSSADGHLPFLTAAQADRVRYLVRHALAERGREVSVYADHLVDDQGGEFGLWNVAAACHNDPRGERAWPAITAEYVGSLLEDIDHDPLDGLTPEGARSRVYVKLVPADALPSRTGLSCLDETVPGLVDALVVDFPGTVASLSDSEVALLGGKSALREAGLARLRALPPLQHKHMAAPDGGTFEVLLGESVYTASRVLVMDDLLKQTPGAETAPHGVLAAMATRNQIAIHVIRGRSAVRSLRLMTRFALAGYSDGTGRLSPNVFWWRDERWAQVTRLDTDGTIRVLDNPDLTSIFRRLDGESQ